MREHSASHSSMLCVVRMTERPAMVDAITPHMKRRDLGSMPVEGSSCGEEGERRGERRKTQRGRREGESAG